jgi:hypothetical protein
MMNDRQRQGRRMTEFAGFQQSIDRARSMNEHFASTARTAAEQMLENGQEIGTRLASQASTARERLLSCLDELASAGDPARASQIGASYISDSLRAYGQNMAEWSELVLRSYRRGLDGTVAGTVPAE